MTATPRMYSEADLQRIVKARLKESADNLVLDGIKTELNGFKAELVGLRQSVDESNHFKREFGAQLNALKDHLAGVASTWVRFHLDDLSDTEAARLPDTIRAFTAGEAQDVIKDAARKDKMQWHQHFWARAGIVTAALYVAIEIVNLFFSGYNALHGVGHPLH